MSSPGPDMMLIMVASLLGQVAEGVFNSLRVGVRTGYERSATSGRIRSHNHTIIGQAQ